MKIRYFIIALCTILLYSCDQYYVPDDFPKKEFYSYAPYKEGDIVRFTDSANDTLTYIVQMVHEYYIRGEKGCKCGKEQVYKHIEFLDIDRIVDGAEDVAYFSLDCTDRSIFAVELGSYNLHTTYAFYQVDYERMEDIWAKSFDETKIFKEFTDTITMSLNDKPTAQIKKNEGILWFIDSKRIKWTSVK